MIQAYHSEFAQAHNNEIYNSDVYKNFKGVNADSIKTLMDKREKIAKQIEALQAQSAKVLTEALVLAGSDSRWYNYSSLVEDYNHMERNKAFSDTIKSQYLSEDQLLVASDRYADQSEELVAKQLLKV